jgi:hypothetical protein
MSDQFSELVEISKSARVPYMAVGTTNASLKDIAQIDVSMPSTNIR